jgi:cytochrome c oxidase assembly protein subunit 15
MQSVHFTNTLLLLGSLALAAWWLGESVRGERELRAIPTGSERGLVGAAWLGVATTMVVGATGSLAALADTLFPSPSLRVAFTSDFAANSPLLVRMRWMHPAAAVVGLCCVLWLALRVRSRLSWVVAGLLGLQFVLGVGDVLLLAPTWMQILHLLGADFYWIALVVLAAVVIWPSASASNASLT